MSLNEEQISNYDDYKERVAALESAGPTKDRIVFLFRPAEGGPIVSALEGVRKKGVNGTLIHVLITKKEFADRDCPYKTDAKFKVTDLPFGVVFNNKLTLGRNMVHKKIVGEAACTELKIADLFK